MLRPGEIHKAVPRTEPGMDGAAPRTFKRHEIHPPLAVAHIPEVRLAAVELGVGPCPPDAVVMDVVGWKVVGDDLAAECADRVQVSAATKKFLDVSARKLAWLGLVGKERLRGHGAGLATNFRASDHH